MNTQVMKTDDALQAESTDKRQMVERSRSLSNMSQLRPFKVVPFMKHPSLHRPSDYSSIEYIEIRSIQERNGLEIYLLDVYLHRISTWQRRRSSCQEKYKVVQQQLSYNKKDRQPNYQLTRRYSDFSRFRREVSKAMCSIRSGFLSFTNCSYCSSVDLVPLCNPGDLICREQMLENFLNRIITCTQSQHVPKNKCLASSLLPSLLNALIGNDGWHLAYA